MPDPRFPIGEWERPSRLDETDRRTAIAWIRATPEKLARAVKGLSDEQLDTPYRDGGWTVRQVVHHLPDSHMNSYVRIKLALTEDTPTIRPYDEKLWAELADSAGPVEPSLTLLRALHARWALLLDCIGEEDWAREILHPEYGWRLRLDQLLSFYAWHGMHHVAHVTALRERKGW